MPSGQFKGVLMVCLEDSPLEGAFADFTNVDASIP